MNRLEGFDPGDWRNPVVALADLPAVDAAPFEPLDVRYLRQQRMAWMVVFGLLLTVGVVVSAVTGAPWWVFTLVIGVPLAATVLAWVLEGLAFSHRGVQLREYDVSTRRGVISRTTTSVPFSRVQHVTVQRGLFDRLFGLATVVIYTAGAVTIDAKVNGLDPERADRLREDIINRSSRLRPGTDGDASPTT